MTTQYHKPVLLRESIDSLNILPGGVYVDATFGGGGHSSRILSKLNANGRLYAFDQDPDAKANVPPDGRLTFIAANFGLIADYLKFYGVTTVDGILADLGVSSHQFDTEHRGFSIRFDGPLDMRMNPAEGVSAADILNSYAQEDLIKIFRTYSEINQAPRLVAAIVKRRQEKAFVTTSDLKCVVESFAKPSERNQFLSRVFQALRMEANQEITALKKLLVFSGVGLSENGRVVVISYHSGEDRLVKNYFASGNFTGQQEKDLYGNVIRPLDPLLRKPLVPNDEEIIDNPRARSAKLRVAQKSQKKNERE